MEFDEYLIQLVKYCVCFVKLLHDCGFMPVNSPTVHIPEKAFDKP
jgi:hypothetical protein